MSLPGTQLHAGVSHWQLGPDHRASNLPPSVPYDPTVGQQGKDVVWVPTGEKLVEKMLDLAQLNADDYVIDLGSGDGRTVIAAAKRGATASASSSTRTWWRCRRTRAAEAGVTERARLLRPICSPATSRGHRHHDVPAARINMQLAAPDPGAGARHAPRLEHASPWATGRRTRPRQYRLRELVHGAVVDRAGEGEGTWQTPDGPLTLEQQFQHVTGSLGGTPISAGRLNGDRIEFQVGEARYTGRVTGGTIEGTVSGGRTGEWSATRQ